MTNFMLYMLSWCISKPLAVVFTFLFIIKFAIELAAYDPNKEEERKSSH